MIVGVPDVGAKRSLLADAMSDGSEDLGAVFFADPSLFFSSMSFRCALASSSHSSGVRHPLKIFFFIAF